MIQQEIGQKNQENIQMNILLESEVKVQVESAAGFFDKIIPTNENKLFIYFENGEYNLYDITSKSIQQQGKLEQGIRVFYQVYAETIFYVGPDDMKIKLLDFKTNQLHPQLQFNCSTKVKHDSNKEAKECLADKLKMISLEAPDCKYLVVQDLQKHYSNESTCTYTIRKLPKDYSQAEDYTDEFEKFEYANRTQQTEIFSWQVDADTLVFFGQDFEQGQTEFLLCKPYMGEKGFKLIKVIDQYSFTLINITNWIEPHKYAIWQNNNDGNAKPTIFLMDVRAFFQDGQWLAESEYRPKKEEEVNGIFGDEPETFMDIYSFDIGSHNCLQFKMIGVDTYLELINLQTRQSVSKYKVDYFFHEIPSNRKYLVEYDDLEVIDKSVSLKIVFPVDARYRLLHIMDKSGMFENYEEFVVERALQFYS